MTLVEVSGDRGTVDLVFGEGQAVIDPPIKFSAGVLFEEDFYPLASPRSGVTRTRPSSASGNEYNTSLSKFK